MVCNHKIGLKSASDITNLPETPTESEIGPSSNATAISYLAIKAMNDTIGPTDLCLLLLCLGNCLAYEPLQNPWYCAHLWRREQRKFRRHVAHGDAFVWSQIKARNPTQRPASRQQNIRSTEKSLTWQENESDHVDEWVRPYIVCRIVDKSHITVLQKGCWFTAWAIQRNPCEAISQPGVRVN